MEELENTQHIFKEFFFGNLLSLGTDFEVIYAVTFERIFKENIWKNAWIRRIADKINGETPEGTYRRISCEFSWRISK